MIEAPPAAPRVLDTEGDWEALHAGCFSVGRRINLNPGTLGTVSTAARAAVADFVAETNGWPLGAYQLGRAAMARARARAARVWGLGPPALTSGTSATMAALSVTLGARRPGATVLFTDEEHDGGAGAFDHAPELRVRAVPVAELGAAAAADPPDLLFVSDVLWTTGRRPGPPPRPREGCWVLVDAAQSLGVQPALPVGDIVVASAHKWLGGPHGTGFVWLGPGVAAVLGPLERCGHPVDPSAPGAGHEPPGGQDFARWAGLDAALALYEAVGPARAAARSAALAERMAAGLADALRRWGPVFLGAEGAGPTPASPSTGMVVVSFPGRDPYPLYQALEADGVHVKCVKTAGWAHLRLGVHWSETAARVDDAAGRFAAAARRVWA